MLPVHLRGDQEHSQQEMPPASEDREPKNKQP